MADLFHRVSIRKYQDRPVERGKDCGNPSRGNGSTVCKEPAAVGILCNYQKDTLEKLSKASPYAGMTANAPVAIISAYRKIVMSHVMRTSI